MILELQATPQEVMRAVDALEELARAQGIPDKTIFGLALALEECGSNIVNHALKRDPRKSFQVRIEHTGDVFLIELRDRGPAFDPTTVAEREARSDDDDDLPGGWGIQLARRYMDIIQYKRQAGENILRLTRRVRQTTDQP